MLKLRFKDLFSIYILFQLILFSYSVQRPVIIIPGFGASQAYFKLKGKDSVPEPLWINPYYLLHVSKLTEYFKLNYNQVTKRFEENEVTDITFPGWGETWSIEKLASWPLPAINNYYNMIKHLQNKGYVTNYTVRGAPYDFRRAPGDNSEFNNKMKELVEETYSNAGNKRVVLIAHSLGTLYTLYFLKSQTDIWKKKYIVAFVALSGPYGGSVKPLQSVLSGERMQMKIISALSYREFQRTLTSMYFLFPDKRIYKMDPIVITPKRNYTANDYKDLFKDIHFERGWEIMNEQKSKLDPFESPTGVEELYCIYGTDELSPTKLVYSKPSLFNRQKFPDREPNIVYENGDGIVVDKSLAVCKLWKDVNCTTIYKSGHRTMLTNTEFFKILDSILQKTT